MAEKKKKVLVQSCPLVALWPKLHEPDTKFNADGEYTFRGKGDPNDPKVAAFIAKVEELVDAAYQKAKDENPKFAKVMKRVSPVKMELDDNGDETGMVTINFKKVAKVTSKKDGKVYTFKVMLYDAQLNPLPKSVKIGGGSVLRASFEPYPYFNAKDKEAGISCRLEAVQVLELKTWNKDGAAFGFGKEEGGFDGSSIAAGEGSGDEFAGAESGETPEPQPQGKTGGDF
jgi:hypothetical protein